VNWIEVVSFGECPDCMIILTKRIQGAEQIIYLSTVRSANILVLERDSSKFDLLGIGIKQVEVGDEIVIDA
jgi:hypothetical protein